MTNKAGRIMLYQTADGITKVEVMFCDDTVWLTLDQMAELLQGNNSVIAKFATTTFGNKTYQVDYYNLGIIISILKSNS